MTGPAAVDGHPLAANALPGLDASRVRRLQEAGVFDLESLVALGPDRLGLIVDFDAKTCRALVRVAQAALARDPDGAVIPFVPDPEDGGARLGRGLQAARRIERSLGRLRQIEGQVAAEATRRKAARALGRARKQLRKLRTRLADLQQEVLAEGISRSGDAHLQAALDTLDRRLEALSDVDTGPDGRAEAFERVRKVARSARKELSG